jgi:hypothetical protein
MKFIPGTRLAVGLGLMLVPFSNGQQDGSNTPEPGTQTVSEVQISPSCTHLFTAGKSTSNAFLQYCVADDGLISSIETPFGHPQLGDQGEGYGLCQESPAVEYHDFAAGESGNWNPAQVVSVSATSIKTSRSTLDGNWTLLQTISTLPLTGSIKMVMALTNHQPVAKVAYLVRFAHVNPDGHDDYITGASLQSAFAWNAYAGKWALYHGLQLANAGAWSGYQQAFIQDATTAPNACAFSYNAYPFGVQGPNNTTSLIYAYVGTIPAHGTKTVTMTYRGT